MDRNHAPLQFWHGSAFSGAEEGWAQGVPRDGEAETEVVRFGVWRFIAFVEKL